MSTKNPFRSNPVSPNPTGATSTSMSGVGGEGPFRNPLPHSNNSAPPPFTETATESNQPSSTNTNATTQGEQRRIPRFELEDEEPPAYTATADQGETTIDRGPRRPFQQPQGPPQQQQQRPQQQHVAPVGGGTYIRPQDTDTGYLNPQWTGFRRPLGSRRGGLLSQLTGQLVDSLNNIALSPPTSSTQGPSTTPGATRQDYNWSPPPERPPQPQPQSPRPLSTLSPAPPRHPTLPRRHSDGSGEGGGSRSDFARDFYAAGTGEGVLNLDSTATGSGNRFQPPSGPPPQSGSNSTRRGGEGPRPTTTPTPGHPLLRDGKILVYPRGYECDKCKNTGYKHLDPTNPCKNCWQKYAKSYSTISYAPSGDTTMQRPLPSTRSPRPTASTSNFNAPSHGGYPGAQYQTRQAPPPRPVLACTNNSYTVPGQFGGGGGHHGGNSIVVQPGDPRIGGRLCWRCDGEGKISVFLFDRETCGLCGGLGRVLR